MFLLFNTFLLSFVVARTHGEEVKTEVVADTNGESACSIGSLQDVCNCDKRSKGSHLCSGCKDPTKWGYGCDLDCSEHCGPAGCDFSGYCNQEKCKRNSRSVSAGEPNAIYNQRGECQACERGSWGLMCEKSCEALVGNNCADTVEGPCTRGGKCYACKKGFYGETCAQPCPGKCEDCVMMDNLIQAPGGKDFLPAGACIDQCSDDHWGVKCTNKCSGNCKKSSNPSCDKYTGDCYKCGPKPGNRNPHQWWGGKCSSPCADGCIDGMCLKPNGNCEKGVKEGYCGIKGDKQCPKHTIGGCDRDTCLPHGCSDGRFPGLLEDGTPTCIGCSENCLRGECDKSGICAKGCIEGFYGKRCDKECSSGCTGACDQQSGKCDACKVGLTGGACEKRCHAQCLACHQYDQQGVGSLLSKPGNGKNDCLTCSDSMPTFLNPSTKTCDCIEGAERREDGLCYCIPPAENNMVEYFVAQPKTCRKKCIDGYKEAYADKAFICLTSKAYKAVYWAEAKNEIKQKSCQSGEIYIDVPGDGHECIRKGFVDYILTE